MNAFNRWIRRIGLVGLGLFINGDFAAGQEKQAIGTWVHATLLNELPPGRPETANPGRLHGAAGAATLGGAGFDPGEIPFSFTYDGRPSSQFLSHWDRTHAAHEAENGRQRDEVTYTDPATGLEISCQATTFAGYPAVEWVLHLRNTGTRDTPILEDIRPLDFGLNAPGPDIVLHHSYGADNLSTDFMPIDEAVPAGASIDLAPNGGRSSDGNLPFFNLEWPGGGLVGAIGWSGQWELRLRRDRATGLRVQAGQQKTHLRLHPGESIRTPSILLVAWEGPDRFRGNNLLRRLLLDHYVPRLNGKIALPPVSQTSFFTWNDGNAVTAANQIEEMPAMAAWGVEAYWLDAGWFEEGYPAGVGNWVPDEKKFPHGLRPVSEAAHKSGLKFILWFEPERVKKTSRIGREHPGWVLHGGDFAQRPDELGLRGSLFNLGDPAAREWMTRLLSKCIQDWGVDVYRNDCNIDPLPFWRALDEPDRQGMAEIRYIEGLYAMWDDLRARNPGLLIDNCSSGGRRLDLETIRRSVPFWRDDAEGHKKPVPVLSQTISAGLSLYVPLEASAAWELDPYSFRSVATTGVNFCMNTRLRSFPVEQARRVVGELKSLRPLYLGDYYPLTGINSDEHQWCAWQFDRPELGRGFALFFRRAQSPEGSFAASLHGLDPSGKYTVTFPDALQVRTMTGSQLAALNVEIDTPATSLLVIYRKRAK